MVLTGGQTQTAKEVLTHRNQTNLWPPWRWRRATKSGVALDNDSAAVKAPLLWIVEGVHDVSFLRGVSRMLHAVDPGVPDVGQLEQAGRLVFVPYGGSDPRPWVTRLAPLGLPELHLYDREFPPVTAQRQAAVDAVNRRPGCRAFLTGLPTIESYLHPAAIFKAGGVSVNLARHEDAVETVARTKYERQHGGQSWAQLPARNRKRLRDRAKHWLNTTAVSHMTPELLAERDPAGDIRRWLSAIAELGG